MSAEEARNKVNALEIGKNAEQLEICEKEINKAVERGYRNAIVGFYLNLPVKYRLEELGYKTESSSQYNEDYTSITW